MFEYMSHKDAKTTKYYSLWLIGKLPAQYVYANFFAEASRVNKEKRIRQQMDSYNCTGCRAIPLVLILAV